MGKKKDDTDDELWLAEIRASKDDDFHSISGASLPPDPWLDGPQPGAIDRGAPPQAPDPFAAPAPDQLPPAFADRQSTTPADPWAHVDDTPAPAPPSDEPVSQWAPHTPPPPAPMPTAAPRSEDPGMPIVQGPREPMPIPRIEDPWAPRPAERADAEQLQQPGYEIPRLQPEQHPPAPPEQVRVDSGRVAETTMAQEPAEPHGGRHALPENGDPAEPSEPTRPAEPAESSKPAESAEPRMPAEPAPLKAPDGGSDPWTAVAGSTPLRQAWEGAPAHQGSGQQFATLPSMPARRDQQPGFPPQAPAAAGPVTPPARDAQTAYQGQPGGAYQGQPGGATAQHAPGGSPPAQTDPFRSAESGSFHAPQAPQTGAFAVPQQGHNGGVPSQLGGQQAPSPSIMPLDLSDAALVKQRTETPEGGWRRAVYKASFGGINPGISREQAEKNALIERIRTPIRGCHKIAVVSLKGGIGKTTTTSCLGLTLAHYRGDRVVALDANPDAGTLAERLTGVTDVSVRDMLDNLDSIRSFTDISRYMSLASRLQVLASDQDAEVSEAFDAEQYKRVTDLLAQYYNVILTDSGTGMLHSAMRGTLEEADSLVVVGAPSVDGSSRAAKTLDWLVAHGYGDLVAGSVAVISSVREKSNSVDMGVLRNHFGARCRSVIEIPFDPHLVIGGRIDMSQISPLTERAYLELAATVADGFRVPTSTRQPGNPGY
ncbi:MinD/ParA family protein [Blastococcus sp. Marseille-P5729]|uniref:MinD/ParA family ATP-binding protein n=1 Tax=Blastococcus sp. Marseille-P5729 TaxID=2086582 RepID=UPI000D0E61CE|nr:MinD/ParA family protein [Blastococcus sp. Marseille-P5729]